jgi:hypothetical protein
MSDQNKTNLTEEDYLRMHLEGVDKKTAPQTTKVNVQVDNSRLSELQYLTVDVKELPCSMFYPADSTLQVRPAQVKEIQAYSMVDDNNIYDIVEKMNDMLLSCVRVKYSNGQIGSYLDLRDPDRFYLIFLIRELTFQNGSTLTTKAPCILWK